MEGKKGKKSLSYLSNIPWPSSKTPFCHGVQFHISRCIFLLFAHEK